MLRKGGTRRLLCPAIGGTILSLLSWLRGIFATMDFAVAPLVDTAFNRAKSDLIFLEYAAAKLPCVASNIGPYSETVKHGETGLLAQNTTESWTEQLVFAATNHKARRNRRRGAR